MSRRQGLTGGLKPAPSTTVREIMTTDAVTVPPDASVARIAVPVGREGPPRGDERPLGATAYG